MCSYIALIPTWSLVVGPFLVEWTVYKILPKCWRRWHLWTRRCQLFEQLQPSEPAAHRRSHSSHRVQLSRIRCRCSRRCPRTRAPRCWPGRTRRPSKPSLKQAPSDTSASLRAANCVMSSARWTVAQSRLTAFGLIDDRTVHRLASFERHQFQLGEARWSTTEFTLNSTDYTLHS